MWKNPRGDLLLEQDTSIIKQFIADTLNYENILENVISVSRSTGEPFIVTCGTCDEFKICIVFHTLLIDDKITTTFKGLFVIVDSSKELDEKIEAIMKNTMVIRNYGEETIFYIPASLSWKTFQVICKDRLRGPLKTLPVPIEEAMVYFD